MEHGQLINEENILGNGHFLRVSAMPGKIFILKNMNPTSVIAKKI